MRVTALIENTASDDSFAREHGLSLFIEANGKRILFDSGQSGSFMDNAQKMNIDLGDIDFVVLSHGHYDHGNGLLRFLEENDTAKIYMNRAVFGEHYHNREKYIGLNQDLARPDRIVFTDDEFDLGDGMALSTCNEKDGKYPIDSSGLYVKKDGCFEPETFRHEQYLLIEENGKKALFSGCSHKGILNIMDWFKPDALIGGFHFMEIEMNEEGRKRLDEASRELSSYSCDYYTGHCTGRKQYAYLKERMGRRLNYLSTGESVEI